ncbi:MAG: hypothetical protein OEM28_12725 [Nitrosopumilus sp.]|nr:hypothetical protein [Nitrosopumilus sp.]
MVSLALVYAETITVDVEGNSFDVEYTVSGITVDAITSDVEASSLYLTVTADSAGMLDVTFNRISFDSVFEGLDEEFFVLVDGDFAIYSETETTTQSRTLSIEVPSGTEEVEIIGTVFGSFESVIVSDVIDDAAAAKAAADAAAAKAAADAAAAKAAADAAAAKAAADAAAAKAAADAAASQTQSTQCGSGTILQNGVCVLDERCGPGTLLKDGVCVLDSTSAPSGSSVGGMGKEMVIAVVIAFVVAGIVAVVSVIISKASKSSS